MAMSTADRYDIQKAVPTEIDQPIATGALIYKGICVCHNDNGFIQPADDQPNYHFAGISGAQRDNAAGDNGDLDVPVIPLLRLNYLELDAVNPNDRWRGDLCYFTDDHTVALGATTVHDVLCGRVIEVTQTGANGRVVVDIIQRR